MSPLMDGGIGHQEVGRLERILSYWQKMFNYLSFRIVSSCSAAYCGGLYSSFLASVVHQQNKTFEKNLLNCESISSLPFCSYIIVVFVWVMTSTSALPFLINALHFLSFSEIFVCNFFTKRRDQVHLSKKEV